MSIFFQQLIRDLSLELEILLDPLVDAGKGQTALYRYLARLGWDLETIIEADIVALSGNIAQIQGDLAQVAMALQQQDEAAMVTEAHTHFRAAIDRLEGLYPLLAGLDPAAALDAFSLQTATELAQDVAESLLLLYIARRVPLAFQVGLLFGVLVKSRPAPIYRNGDPTQPVLRYPIERATINWRGLLSPAGNPFLALLYDIDLGKVHSLDDFMAQVQRVITKRLADLRRAVGSRGLDGMAIHLNHTGVSLIGGGWLPLVEAGAQAIEVTVPESFAPTLTINEQLWRVSWLADLAENTAVYPLFKQDWIEVVLLANEPENDTPPGMNQPGFYLREEGGGLLAEFSGGIGVTFPLNILTDTNGGLIRGQARARLQVLQLGQATLEVAQLLVAGEFHLGGADGLSITEAQIEMNNFVWPPGSGEKPFGVRMQGQLNWGDASQITVAARFDQETLEVSSTGEVHLGDGIRLLPIGDEAVLSLKSEIGATAEFEVNALFKAPYEGEADGTRTVQVEGDLILQRAPDGLWIVESFEAKFMGSDLQWTLPGDIVLTDASFELDYDGVKFCAAIGGGVTVGDGEARITAEMNYDAADPTRIDIDSSLELTDINLFDQGMLFALDTRLQVSTRVENGVVTASGVLSVNNATAGLFPLATWNAANPQTEQFQLAVVGVQGSFAFDADGFALTATGGILQLPPSFGPDPDTPGALAPTVSLDNNQPLTITANSSSATFDGTFIFANFGVRLSDVLDSDDFVARLESAELLLSSAELPILSNVSGSIRLPLPDDQRAAVAFDGICWQLDGLPEGSVYFAESLPIDLGGMQFIICGGDDSGDTGTGLSINRSGNVTSFEFNAAMRVIVAADLLTDADGDEIFLEAGGSLALTTDDPLPAIAVSELRAGGTFHFGGKDGLEINGAEITAENIDNLFTQSAANPFVLNLSGELVLPNDGPRGGLNEARFIFEGLPWPRFELGGVSAGMGNNMGDMDIAGGYLPVVITRLALTFDDNEPMPQRMLPQHTTADVDAEINIQKILCGSVKGLKINFPFELDADGNPQLNSKLAIDGFHLEVPGLELDEGFTLGGGMGIAGLDDIPNSLVLAGNLGGVFNGTGVKALVAAGIVDGVPVPLGISLQASLGAAGIPLWASGFLLTGAAGGVSFTGGNADPDDLRNYIEVADDGSVSSQPRPPAEEAADAGPDEQKRIAGAAESEADPPDDYDCPTEPCPPPSVGILYQPHPDAALYANRVIWKFSSLDRDMVDLVLEQISLDKAALQGMTPEAIASQVSAGMATMLQETFPFLPGETEEMVAPLEEMLTEALTTAYDSGANMYEALVAAAYKGVRAPNVTLKLTGTLSYTGISAFLSITGGVVLSPSQQYAGIVGSLNLLGIPVGQLRAFLTMNNAAGNPDPFLCGDLAMALGPLDLGLLRMTSRFGFDLVSFSVDFLDIVDTLSLRIAANVLDVVNEPLFESNGRDVQDTLLAMEPQEHLAFVSLLMQQPQTGDIRPFLVALFDKLWQNFNPEMLLCGSVQPKLFGMALDGELVGVAANLKKDETGIIRFASEFRFSPSGLLSRVFYGVLPTGVPAAFDQMKLSLRFEIPDPRPLIEAGIGSAFIDPQRMFEIAVQQYASMLEGTVATIEYEIAPMGIKLADAEARLLMPEVFDHPSRVSWTRPAKRPLVRGQSKAYPSRLEVAAAALAAGKLGDIFWQGSADELQALPELADAYLGELALRKDYFPHGGILGAGRLMLPDLFLDPPPLDVMQKLTSGQLSEQLEAAGTLLDLLTNTNDVGELAFYMPAPNPPPAPTPEELMEAMSGLEFDLNDMHPGQAYAFEQSFMRGGIGSESEPMHLLGVPIGYATVELMPPDNGADGYLLIIAGVPENSWLQLFVDEAKLEFSVRQTPPEAVEDHFRRLQQAFANPLADFDQLIQRLTLDMQRAMPKVSLVGQLDDFKIPTALADVLGISGSISAELHAYSPLYKYNPRFRGGDALATAQNFGGVAIQINGELSIGGNFGLSVTESSAQLAVTPSAAVFPALDGRFQAARVGLPFGLPDIDDAVITFHSDAGDVPALPRGGLLIEGTIEGERIIMGFNFDRNGASLSGRARLGIYISDDIGPIVDPLSGTILADEIVIDTAFEGLFAMTLRPPGDVSVRVADASFSWNSQTWQLPDFRIESGAAPSVQSAVLNYIAANALDIFGDLFNDGEAWFPAWQSGALGLSDLSARTLASILDMLDVTTSRAAQMLAEAIDNVQDVIEGLYWEFGENISQVLGALRGAGFGQSQDIADAMHTLFGGQYAGEVAQLFFDSWGWTNPALETANRLFTAHYTPREIARALESTGAVSINLAAQAMNYAQMNVQQVIDALYQEFGRNISQVLGALRGAGFGQSQDIADAMHTLFGGQYAGEVAQLFFDSWGWTNPALETANRLFNANYSPREIARALESTGAVSINLAAQAMNYAQMNVQQVIDALYQEFGRNISQVLGALRGAGFNESQDIANAMHNLFGGQFVGDVAQLFFNSWTQWSNPAWRTADRLKSAGYSPREIARGLQSTGAVSIDLAAEAMKLAGIIAEDVGKGLKNIYTNITNDAAIALKAAGFNAEDVGKGLKDTFTTSTNNAAKALKAAGFNAEDVGKGLKNTFTNSTNNAAKALKAADFDADNVAEGLKTTFTINTETAAKALKAAEFDADHVASGLHGTFTNSTTTAAKALAEAGFDVLDVCWALYDNFSKNMATLISAMNATNFAPEDINKAIADVFDLS